MSEVQRYKIGYATDDWAMLSSTPSGLPDSYGSWVKYSDYAALAAAAAPAQERIDALELEVRQLTERTAALQKPYEKGKHMTPAEHAKAIEDAAHRYARDFAVYCDGKEPVDLGVCNVSLAILQSAIIAGVGAAPEGWQLVPVEPTNAMLDALEDAARYRWLASHCRSTSEHWGGRWSIVVDGPTPKSHDSEDDFDAAIDAAMDKERRAFVAGVKAATEPPAKPKPCGACSGSGRYDSTGSPKMRFLQRQRDRTTKGSSSSHDTHQNTLGDSGC